MNSGVDYKLFYEILLALREKFHSHGRIDDSNMKLDEIVKLIMLSYHLATHGTRFSLEFVKNYANQKFASGSKVASALRVLFSDASKDTMYLNADETSIFGANPSLNIQPSEDSFAEMLVSEIGKIDFVNLLLEKKGSNFDILNECFGHFVRENFRNNKEDAQYMTPAEITDPMLSLVFDDFNREKYFKNLDLGTFTVMDPTCGVGTLLIASAKKYLETIKKYSPKNYDTVTKRFLSEAVIGQDKVDRMVRLSKINSLLLGANCNNIFSGNSISDITALERYQGKIDLIFTNPPFGAEYERKSLTTGNFEALDVCCNGVSTIPSEILMLLKCLMLLKPNGKLVIVLPDSVFSADGVNRCVREYLISNYTINAVIEMPAVTFAQAGTRTKTSILYLTKKRPSPNHEIIMSVCEDIGYLVKEKSGVPIKIEKGVNQMQAISSAYCERTAVNAKIISSEPSVTKVQYCELIDGVLNPSFYNSSRLSTLSILQTKKLDGFELRNLDEVVIFDSLGRRSREVSESVKHISVLHVNADCTIDFQQVEIFKPICKGRSCSEGDILFSKINPRIPRMTVVPSYPKSLVCSNEFEIMRPRNGKWTFAICLLLKTSYVSRQIENLTSGTSSSHSRIKREQLKKIKVPFPVTPKAMRNFQKVDDEIRNAIDIKYKADEVLRGQLKNLEDIL